MTDHPSSLSSNFHRKFNEEYLQVEVQLLQSLKDDKDVVLETYLLAYEEINKIFLVLGKVSISFICNPSMTVIHISHDSNN